MTVGILPGLPALPSSASSLFTQPGLLMSDGAGVPDRKQERWGVFDGGLEIIHFDTFLSIDYRQGWAISDYPIEDGAFQSYDKVYLPFDVRVRFGAGGSEQNRSQLLRSVEAIAGTLKLYQVVTPEAVYRNVNVQHYDYRRTNTNGLGIIAVELWLLEVRTNAKTSFASSSSSIDLADNVNQGAGAAPITSPTDPQGTSPSFNGDVQGVPLPTPDPRFSGFQPPPIGTPGGGAVVL